MLYTGYYPHVLLWNQIVWKSNLGQDFHFVGQSTEYKHPILLAELISK